MLIDIAVWGPPESDWIRRSCGSTAFYCLLLPPFVVVLVVFNMLECEIRRRWFKIDNEVDLIAQIHDIIKTRAGPRFRERLVEGEVLKEGKLEDS